jgi:predicted nuclease of predicted toxin-antitoxin system
MKVRWLVNENFPAPSVAVMRASGYDVLPIAESHSGDDDTKVLALAREEGRWLVTFDRDYGELLFARNYAPPPAVILLRVAFFAGCVPHSRGGEPPPERAGLWLNMKGGGCGASTC